jgi:lysine 2,3-aminomutase
MSDDAVVLRNYEGMLVRYQAEDRPPVEKKETVRPARNGKARKKKAQSVSSLMSGTPTALIPKNNERMARRAARQHAAIHEPHGCGEKDGACNGEEVLAGADSASHGYPLRVVSRNGRGGANE